MWWTKKTQTQIRSPACKSMTAVDNNTHAMIDEMLSAETPIIQRIRIAAGGTDELFNELYLTAIRTFITYVYKLPVTKAGHHSGQAGLLRHGLEVSFFILQSSDGVVFIPPSRGTTEQRYHFEPRYRYAAFLIGLCYCMKYVINSQVVASNGAHWNPYSSSLLDWKTEAGTGDYVYESREELSDFALPALTSALLMRLIPEAGYRYMVGAGKDLIELILLTATGNSATKGNVLAGLLERSVNASIETNANQARKSGTQVANIVPLDRMIIDTMRVLLKDRWKVNKPGARVIVSGGDVYVSWLTAVPEILDILRRNSVIGIPSAPETLAEILLENGLLTPFSINGSDTLFWPIFGNYENGSSVKQLMIRLSRANILFPLGQLPQDIEIVIESVPTQNTNEKPQARSRNAPDSQFKPPVENVMPQAVQQILDLAKPEIFPPTANTPTTIYSLKSIEEQGMEGHLLIGILRDIVNGKWKKGRDWQPLEHGMALAHPKVLGNYGIDTNHAIKAMSSLGWVMPDPNNHMKFAYQIEMGPDQKQQCIVLRNTVVNEPLYELGFS